MQITELIAELKRFDGQREICLSEAGIERVAVLGVLVKDPDDGASPIIIVGDRMRFAGAMQ